jgi:lipopolysaccharide/colanic/teichoic acid biosynthesis glycosyltransferase
MTVDPRVHTSAVPAPGRSAWAGKRALDLCIAVPALVLTAPLLVAAYLLVRVTSPGPGIFRQTRVGYAQQPFTMYKLRTMYVDSPDAPHRAYVQELLAKDAAAPSTDGVYKLSGDTRVTPVGRLLRRTSVDELPQLVNVIRGEMSLVGPRPVLPWEVELFDARYLRRFAAPPGITGLWQVSGRSDLSWDESVRLDLHYVENWSLALDLHILWRTMFVVLGRHGAY